MQRSHWLLVLSEVGIKPLRVLESCFEEDLVEANDLASASALITQVTILDIPTDGPVQLCDRKPS